MLTIINTIESKNAQKNVIRSLISSINCTLINLARQHHRQNAQPDEHTINSYNDALAIEDERLARDFIMNEAGAEVPVAPMELISKYASIRCYMVWVHDGMKRQRDFPVATIEESLRFLTRDERTLTTREETTIQQLKDTVGMSEADLERLILADKQRQRERLISEQDAILAILHDATRTFDGMFVGDDMNVHHQEIEAVFDSLPASRQHQLASKIATIMQQAKGQIVTRMLRGRSDDFGDIAFLDAARNEVIAWIKTFTAQHRHELAEYEARGGELAELN